MPNSPGPGRPRKPISKRGRPPVKITAEEIEAAQLFQKTCHYKTYQERCSPAFQELVLNLLQSPDLRDELKVNIMRIFQRMLEIEAKADQEVSVTNMTEWPSIAIQFVKNDKHPAP